MTSREAGNMNEAAQRQVTVVGFAGFSNSGKTTLIARLVPRLKERGLRPAVIKHDGHDHYREAEGSDSETFIRSGADAVVVMSRAAVRKFRRSRATLEEVIAGLEGECDLVLIEGFKRGSHPMVAVFRSREQAAVLRELASPPIAWVTTCASDAEEAPACPVFHPDEIGEIAAFIVRHMEASG